MGVFTNGLVVECFFVGGAKAGSLATPLPRKPEWTSLVTGSGPVANTAARNTVRDSSPCIRCSAGANDWFVAIGPNPDVVNGPRFLVRAGTSEDRFCDPGDSVAVSSF